MAEFTYSNVEVAKDYRNDGMTDQWIVTFDLHLNGDTYKVIREFEFGEYGECAFSLSLDGIDLTDERNWPNEEPPHVVKALADRYEDGTYWFDTLPDWVDDTFLAPVWERVREVEHDLLTAVRGTTGTGTIPDA